MKYNKWFFTSDWKNIEIKTFENNDRPFIWLNGVWYNGYWRNGSWIKGTWYDGNWYNGKWKNGIWHNGTWKNGKWKDGVWKNGVWIKGKIYNLKTDKYENSKISPNECKWSSSYAR